MASIFGKVLAAVATDTNTLFESEVDLIDPIINYPHGDMSTYYGSGNNPFDLVNNRVLFPWYGASVNETISKIGITAVTLSCWSYIPFGSPASLNSIAMLGDSLGMDFVSIWHDNVAGQYVIRTKHSEHRSAMTSWNTFVHLAVTVTDARVLKFFINGQEDRGITVTLTGNGLGLPSFTMSNPKLTLGDFSLMSMNMKTDLTNTLANPVQMYCRCYASFVNSVVGATSSISAITGTVPTQSDPTAYIFNTQKLTANGLMPSTSDADNTISFWIKLISTSYYVIFTGDGSAMLFGISPGSTTGWLYEFKSSTGQYVSRFIKPSAVNQYDWHHVVFSHTASGSTDRCYINGEECVIHTTLRTGPYSGFSALTINNTQNGNFAIKEFAFLNIAITSTYNAILLMNGRSPAIFPWTLTAADSMLSDIRAYDRVLTEDQIRQLALQDSATNVSLNINNTANAGALTTRRHVSDVSSVGILNVMLPIDQFTAERATGWWASSPNDRSFNKCDLYKSSGASFASGFPYVMFLGSDYMTTNLPLTSTTACSSLSISFWMYMTSGQSGTYSVVSLGDAVSFFRIDHNESSATLYVRTNRTQQTYTSLYAASKAHIGVIYDGYVITLYLNGVLKTPTSSTTTNLAKWSLTSNKIQFGFSHIDNSPPSQTLCLEDIRLFLGQILTTVQMSDLYLAKIPLSQFPGSIITDTINVTGTQTCSFGGSISVPTGYTFLQNGVDTAFPVAYLYCTVNAASVASGANAVLSLDFARVLTIVSNKITIPAGYTRAIMYATPGITGGSFFNLTKNNVNITSTKFTLGGLDMYMPFLVSTNNTIAVRNNDASAQTIPANQHIIFQIMR